MLALVCFSLVLLSFYAHGHGHELPSKIIAGYAPSCSDLVYSSAVSGVNVIYWFSANLFSASTGWTVQYGGPSLSCIGNISSTLKANGLETVHMLTFGGWDSVHPIVANSSSDSIEAFNAFNTWNKNEVNKYLPGGFQGIDWDYEGNDDLSSVDNFYTIELLDFMGLFSQLAKSSGYIVSLVPPESYFDITLHQFDQAVNHPYTDGWQPSFLYHGHNTYSYIFARYGVTPISSSSSSSSSSASSSVPTFDLVLIQLYESYSHLSYNVSQLSQSPVSYLTSWVTEMTSTKGHPVPFLSDKNVTGWIVDNHEHDDGDDNDDDDVIVKLAHTQLLIGFAGSWAGSNKVVLVCPSEIGLAHRSLSLSGVAPRGYFFWSINEEGGVATVTEDDSKVREMDCKEGKLYMAQGFNSFMNTRTNGENGNEQTM